jgi:hypothetical protein
VSGLGRADTLLVDSEPSAPADFQGKRPGQAALFRGALVCRLGQQGRLVGSFHGHRTVRTMSD